MFETVQSIARDALPMGQSLKTIIALARSSPTLFEGAEYWNQAQGHDFQAAFSALTGWAKQGFAALGPRTGWQFVLLDLGDCPEVFRLYSPGGQELMSEQKFGDVLTSELIIRTSDMEYCFGSDVADPFDHLFGRARVELSDHHVSELGDNILDWTDDAEMDFHGNSGYLLWLTLGSLALMEPLRDVGYCKAILQGRDKLHLLSGFEEIFYYIATVTPDGLSYEAG